MVVVNVFEGLIDELIVEDVVVVNVFKGLIDELIVEDVVVVEELVEDVGSSVGLVSTSEKSSQVI